MSLEKLLSETLTTHDYQHGNGVVHVNVADGLFAIATAIQRLADVIERKPISAGTIIDPNISFTHGQMR